MYLVVCFRVFVCVLFFVCLAFFFPFLFVFVFHVLCVFVLFYFIFLRDDSPLWQEFPSEIGRRILLVLFSPQGTHPSFFPSLPTFPSAAMQCQRWLQAQAQSLTLPQSPGSGEKPENTWPFSHNCCSLSACSGGEGRAGTARQVKSSFASDVHDVSAGQDEKEQKSKR